MGEWLLSRRDRLIVARHEVPQPGEKCLARRAVPKGAGGVRLKVRTNSRVEVPIGQKH